MDQLRKTARGLESEVDLKLTAYTKLQASYAHQNLMQDKERENRDSSSEPLLVQPDHMAQEIEDLITRLGEVNEQMSLNTDHSLAASNYITNHRNKLFEFSQEFKRIKAQIHSAREHAELLSSVRNDISQYKNSAGSRQDNLLRERAGLHSSERMIDNILGQALETRETLNNQRNFIENSLFKVRNISRAFPGISRAMSTISRRKKRDLFIVATFIAFCMGLLILFLANR